MSNRGIYYKFAVLIVVALAITFSGCTDPQGGLDGTGLASSTGVANNNQLEAIKLYVDAMMLNDIKDWDQAIKKLNTAIEYAPEFSLAHSFKGDIYQLTRQYEASADAYDEATKLDPWSFDDFSNLGKVCQIIEDFARAVKAYVSACELKPENYQVHLGAGRCYYELQDYELASGYGKRAREINPEKGGVDVLLGDIYVAKSDALLAQQQFKTAKAVLVDALDAYKRALELEGNKPDILVSLAVAYIKMAYYDITQEDKNTNYQAAEELLNSAVEMNANTGTLYQYLGFVQLKLHKENLGLATESYEKAIELDAKDWMAHKGMGVIYMLKYYKLRKQAEEKGTLDQLDPAFKNKAMKFWDTSLAIKPNQPELQKLYQDCIEL